MKKFHLLKIIRKMVDAALSDDTRGDYENKGNNIRILKEILEVLKKNDINQD